MLYWLAPGGRQASCHPEPRLGASLSVSNYAFNVYRELIGALKGLVEKE